MKTPTYSQFVLRRLHSLTGVIPLTFFIFFHFFANSYSAKGADAFNVVVGQLRGLPFLLAIEWGLLFAPFLFHMFYGLYVIFTAQSNPVRQSYGRNWAFVMQRVTAIVVFVFILYHVVTLRYGGEHEADMHTFTKNQLSNSFVYWWYVVGVACTCYHLANGLCTFMMTWGITVGRNSQRAAAGAMAVLGLILFAIGMSAINGFFRPPVSPDLHIETAGRAHTEVRNGNEFTVAQ